MMNSVIQNLMLCEGTIESLFIDKNIFFNVAIVLAQKIYYNYI